MQFPRFNSCSLFHEKDSIILSIAQVEPKSSVNSYGLDDAQISIIEKHYEDPHANINDPANELIPTVSNLSFCFIVQTA